MHKTTLACATLAALGALGTGIAHAADAYPSRPIRLIVPYPPGSSSNDILGRALAQRLTQVLGQQVVVDNRSGASGTLGTEIVARATPDGYTLGIAVAGPLTIGPSVYKKIGYDPVKDFAPVARFALIPYVMAVNLQVPAKNVSELIALAKSRPGQLNFGSSGNGGTPHLCGELFKTMTGVQMTHVPYKGGALATIDLLAGHVQMLCTGLTALSSHIKSGKLRALGIATEERTSLMPDLPSISEQGVKGFDVNSWSGVLAPAGTPEPIVRQLYEAVEKVVKSEDMRAFMMKQGAEPALMEPARFQQYIASEVDKWSKVAKAAGVRND